MSADDKIRKTIDILEFTCNKLAEIDKKYKIALIVKLRALMYISTYLFKEGIIFNYSEEIDNLINAATQDKFY